MTPVHSRPRTERRLPRFAVQVQRTTFIKSPGKRQRVGTANLESPHVLHDSEQRIPREKSSPSAVPEPSMILDDGLLSPVIESFIDAMCGSDLENSQESANIFYPSSQPRSKLSPILRSPDSVKGDLTSKFRAAQYLGREHPSTISQLELAEKILDELVDELYCHGTPCSSSSFGEDDGIKLNNATEHHKRNGGPPFQSFKSSSKEIAPSDVDCATQEKLSKPARSGPFDIPLTSPTVALRSSQAIVMDEPACQRVFADASTQNEDIGKVAMKADLEILHMRNYSISRCAFDRFFLTEDFCFYHLASQS